MNAPIKRFPARQVITSPFGMREGRMHRGVDLRSRRFLPGKGFVEQWRLQDVVATEDCEVLRFGTDNLNNDYIVFHGARHELKYIHVTVLDHLKEQGRIVRAGDKIGKTQLKGSSRAHHLHFEVWEEGKPINPVAYFDLMDIKYKFKNAA